MNLINKQLLLEDLKTKKWIPILSSISLLVIYLLTFTSYFLDTGRAYDYAVYIYFFIFLTLLFPFVVLLVGLYNFSFIHGKPKVDFYHGLPIQRKTLYCTNYLSGLILSFLPFIIFGILTLFIGFIVLNTQTFPYPAADPTTYYDEFILSSKLFIRAILLVFVGYSFIGLCATLTGKLFSHIFTIIISVIAPIIIIIFTFAFIQISINHGISFDNFINSLAIFIFDFNFNLRGIDVGELKNHMTVTILSTIVIFLIGILFNILALYFYKNYKSENTGKFFANNYLHMFYKYLTIITIAIIITSIPIISTNTYVVMPDYLSNCLLFFVIFFIASLLVYIIISTINEGSFSKKTITLKGIIAIITITIAYNSVALLDPFGLREFTPKAEKLDSIVFNYMTYNNKEVFEDLIEIHLAIIEEEIENNGTPVPLDYKNITYKYKSGREVTRYYRYYPTEDIINKLKDFYTSENYKNVVINNLENIRDTIENEDENYYYDGTITFYNSIISYTPSNFAETKQFIDALILDIKADTEFGKFNEQNFGFMNINYDYTYGYIYNNYIYNNLPSIIKSNYTNVLSLVDQFASKPSNDNECYIITYKLDNNKLFNDASLSKNLYLTYYNYADSVNFEYSDYSTISVKSTAAGDFDTLTDYYSDENVRDIELISYNNNYEEFMEFFNTKKTFVTDNYKNYMIFDKDKEVYVASIITTSGDNIIETQKLGGFYK